MKKLAMSFGLALCLTSGLSYAAGVNGEQDEYARIISASGDPAMHSTLSLANQPGSMGGRYEWHSQIIKNGRVVSDQKTKGVWNAESVALDGRPTLYVLTPDQMGETRFALLAGDGTLRMLGGEQSFARVDDGDRMLPAR